MEENANTFMMELCMKELVDVGFGEYKEAEDELSHQHCCSAFLFLFSCFVAAILPFVASIAV
jgi:hypothetical protein